MFVAVWELEISNSIGNWIINDAMTIEWNILACFTLSPTLPNRLWVKFYSLTFVQKHTKEKARKNNEYRIKMFTSSYEQTRFFLESVEILKFRLPIEAKGRKSIDKIDLVSISTMRTFLSYSHVKKKPERKKWNALV